MNLPSQQQSETTVPSGTRYSQRFRKLWAGPDKPATRWRSLVGGAIVLFLSNIVLTVGLATIRWTMPLKLVGVACLFLAAGGLFLGVRSLINVVVQLGLKRLLVRLAMVYLIAVITVGLVLQTDEQGAGHWFASAGIVARWAIGGIGNLGRAVLQAPDMVSFAATGRRKPIKVPGGVEWVGGVPPTPIVVPALSGDEINTPPQPNPNAQAENPGSESEPLGREWQVGDRVRVVKTDGDRLLAHQTPALNAKIAAHFPPNSVLTIVDGPQTADGHVWWKVQGGTDEGWCVSDYLAPE